MNEIIGLLQGFLILLGLYFASPYISLLFKWILNKFGNFAFILIVMLVLNLAGSLIAFTAFHLYASIVLSVASFITTETAGIIGSGFTGIFIFVIGALFYKMFK